ncbi:hypothetical protein [Streptomyces sp. NPDC093600]|uniref:hypothetical protein n=1 Tax=Streptomyces sp. NPDC093600 TaxID=3366047 RepID=UPI0038251CDB
MERSGRRGPQRRIGRLHAPPRASARSSPGRYRTDLTSIAEPGRRHGRRRFRSRPRPRHLVPVLAKAAQRIPVVLASRTGAGTSLTHAYGFDGSEKDLLSRGPIGAGQLDPYESRHLLTVLLRSGAENDTIHATFAPAGTTAEGRG